MTVQRPARGSFPDLEPAGKIAPSLPVLDGHVKDLVESQNWAAAYLGRMHATQPFQTGPASVPLGDTTRRHLLTYLVIPRVHCTGLEWRMRIKASDAAANITIEFECAENGEAMTPVVSAGGVATRYETGDWDIMREDQLSTIHVYLTASAGSVEILSLSLADRDLAAADLHFDYYATTATAAGDALARYWPMQEDDDAGVDATADDALPIGDLTAHNGVTIDSEVVNVDRHYYRVLGTSDYLDGALAANATADWTQMIVVQPNLAVGTHCFLSNGTDKVALGSSGTGVVLAVGGAINTWAAALPFAELTVLFIVFHYIAAGGGATSTTTLYSADGLGTVTQRAQITAAINTGTGIRIGRGYAADSTFDDSVYMDDGLVSGVAHWIKGLSLMEMNAVARHLRYRGALLVR